MKKIFLLILSLSISLGSDGFKNISSDPFKKKKKKGKKGNPPFRDSKLTLVLKDALMGNSQTLLLACISPSRFNLEETITTLEFAARCKLVKTNAKKNEQAKGEISFCRVRFSSRRSNRVSPKGSPSIDRAPKP